MTIGAAPARVGLPGPAWRAFPVVGRLNEVARSSRRQPAVQDGRRKQLRLEDVPTAILTDRPLPQAPVRQHVGHAGVWDVYRSITLVSALHRRCWSVSRAGTTTAGGPVAAPRCGEVPTAFRRSRRVRRTRQGRSRHPCAGHQRPLRGSSRIDAHQAPCEEGDGFRCSRGTGPYPARYPSACRPKGAMSVYRPLRRVVSRSHLIPGSTPSASRGRSVSVLWARPSGFAADRSPMGRVSARRTVTPGGWWNSPMSCQPQAWNVA